MERLNEHIKEFVPSLRLGLDIGEWTGGIALVRGNEVLHAETYTDHHATTLKDRRTIRRGRRTRRAKKMRLARLRLWILRAKLPDKSRLPDPYLLMSRKEYQHPPAELSQHHPVHRESEAFFTSPWSYAVIQGIRRDPQAFVLALTHIFQKRGYKYDTRSIGDLTPDELMEFLKSCCLLEKAQALRDELEKKIRKLEEEEEAATGGQNKSRRKNKRRISELRQELKNALTRPPEPRKALPRQMKEEELRQLVKAFGDSAGLSEQTVREWQDQLIKLLNKVIREPRFDNRVISGCSWCGKNTPRKSRPGVRELAFKAAVQNIRKDRLMPLSEEEKREFLGLFRDADFKEKSLKARMSRFEGLLKRHHAQVDMASQLAELCGKEAPKGRTSLCLQHLKMQAEGAFKCNRHPGWICKMGGPDDGHTRLELLRDEGPAERLARNPCREAHEERVIRRIEQILFNPDGAPRFGEIPRLISIEFPKPNTAHTDRCPYCHEKLAIDPTAKEKINPPYKLYRHKEKDSFFHCPACGGPLTIKGKKRNPKTNKEYTYEFSDQDAFLRKAKGGMKEKKKREYLKETKGLCVYCGKKIEDISGMEPDHIFPRSRGGPNVDSNLVASCLDCNKQKGDRTPWEWIGGSSDWESFEKRLRSLPLPQRKKEILLSREEYYPENPTALARATARKRAFIARLSKMLEAHGVSRDQISLNYERDKKVVIQTVEGWTTSRLRNSWRYHEDGSANFPPKQDWNLHNHAEDAAIIAASPPHTWRESVFVETRPIDDPERPVPGLCPRSLAPNWSAYFERVAHTRPLVTVLGDYRSDWKRTFADLTYFSPRFAGKKRTQRVSIEDLKAKRFRDVVDRKIREKLEALKEKYVLSEKKGLPPEAIEELRQDFPGLRRVRIGQQPGGAIITVTPRDGPPRLVQVKPGADGAIFWLMPGRTLQTARDRDFTISLIRPAPLKELKVSPLIDPEIKEGATVVAEWHRYDFVYLPAIKGQKEGWYQVKELSGSGIKLLPETAIRKELADRMGLTSPASAEDTEEKSEEGELALGKNDLLTVLRWEHYQLRPHRATKL
jgi:5-methylcytosine-specific restriction endonuclease McrA